MKVTKEYLKQIIQEEVKVALGKNELDEASTAGVTDPQLRDAVANNLISRNQALAAQTDPAKKMALMSQIAPGSATSDVQNAPVANPTPPTPAQPAPAANPLSAQAQAYNALPNAPTVTQNTTAAPITKNVNKLMNPGRVNITPTQTVQAGPGPGGKYSMSGIYKGKEGEYTVKPGDTLSKLAKTWGTTLKAIALANPNIKNLDAIRVGSKINKPSIAKQEKDELAPIVDNPPTASQPSSVSNWWHNGSMHAAQITPDGIATGLENEKGIIFGFTPNTLQAKGNEIIHPKYGKVADSTNPNISGAISTKTVVSSDGFGRSKLYDDAGKELGILDTTNFPTMAKTLRENKMRISKKYLEQVIKEETVKVMQEAMAGITPDQPYAADASSTPVMKQKNKPSEMYRGKEGNYMVGQGETLSSIAKKNNISLQELIRFNPQIKNPNAIMAGSKIFVPGASAVTGGFSAPMEEKQVASMNENKVTFKKSYIEQVIREELQKELKKKV